MARFTSALLKLTTTNLSEIVLALKADVKEESNYRRIRRFLSDYEVGFTTLGRLLTRLLPQKPPCCCYRSPHIRSFSTARSGILGKRRSMS
jgi:hypothetical protein